MNNFKNIMNYRFWRGLFLVFLFVLVVLPFTSSAESLITFPDKIDTLQERINLQIVLNRVINPSPSLVTDGKIGRKTIQAIQVFQELKGLTSDGKPGPFTRQALELAQVSLSTNTDCKQGDIFSSVTGQSCTTNQTPSTPLVYTPELDIENLNTSSVQTEDTNTNTNINTNTNTVFLSINLTSPLNNAILNNNNVSLNFTTTGNPVYCWYDLGGLRVEDGAIGDPTNTQYQYPLPNCQSQTITLPNRDYVLNIWARDALGSIVFNSTWFNVLATTNDTIPPTVTAFAIPPTSTTLTVPVAPFNATDNIAVTGRLLTETSTTPSPSSNSWATTTPTSYTFSSPGNKTLYAWARDAAGNVSSSMNDSVTITMSGSGNTIYIDPTYTGANGTENGTIERPYNAWSDITFQNNMTYLQKRGTTYNTTSTLTVSGRNGVTIGAYGTGNRPIITNTGTGNIIGINSSTSSFVKDLELIGNSNSINESGGVVFGGTSPSNNTVDNCVIHEIGNGVTGMEANNIKVINTEIYNTKRDGIYFASVTNTEIAYTNIHHVNLLWFTNTNDNISNGDGVQLDGDSNGFYFHHNTIDRSATGNKFGLIIANISYYNITGVIEHNTFLSPSNNYSLALWRGNNVRIGYNTFQGSYRGIRLNMDVIVNTKIYGNIFKNLSLGMAIITGPVNTSIYNNVFYDVDEHIYNNGTGTMVRNNIFHLTQSTDRALTGSGTTASNNCFSSGPGSGTNPVIGNPLFVNAGAGDFHLQNGSPCINTGTNVGLLQDRDGVSIPQGSAPDIGAYESTTVLGVSTYHFTQKLELGSKGNEVKELQKILIAKGYLQGTSDGDFGPYTFEAVKAYQKASGLIADGLVGAKTREFLNK